jgi:predicted metal-binding membrane protein
MVRYVDQFLSRQRSPAFLFLPIPAALIALAWVALWAWARSPYGGYVEHGDWTASGPAASLCRIVPGGDVVVPVVLYAVAWILVTAAMMLPTTLPLFTAFDQLTAGRPDHGRLLMLLGSGYMTVWAAFGHLAHALHSAILALLASVPTLSWAVALVVTHA